MKKPENFEQSLKAALMGEFGKAKGEQIYLELCRIETSHILPTLFGRAVTFDDLPALGHPCLAESISQVVTRRWLAPQDGADFSRRIIACLENVKKTSEDARVLEQHRCCFSYELGKQSAVECIARQRMRKNGIDRPSVVFPRKAMLISTKKQ